MTPEEKLLEIDDKINWYMKGMPYAKLCYEAWPFEAKRHYGWLRSRKKKLEKEFTEFMINRIRSEAKQNCDKPVTILDSKNDTELINFALNFLYSNLNEEILRWEEE